MKSGFVAVAGRPNVGKSTLVNALCGGKVAIVSDKPQTTRRRIRGIVNGDDHQLVLVDLPGFQRPLDPLTEHMQRTVDASLEDVDATVIVLDGRQRIGGGDRFVAKRVFGLGVPVVIVLNKVDRMKPEEIAAQIDAASKLGDFHALHPVSARTGTGVDELRDELVGLLPEGPAYFPTDQRSDLPVEVQVAEIIREKALALTREELPHALSVEVEELGDKVVRAVVYVETQSQKGIVVGKGGHVVREIGVRARPELEPLLGTADIPGAPGQGEGEVALGRADAGAAGTVRSQRVGVVVALTLALALVPSAGAGRKTIWRLERGGHAHRICTPKRVFPAGTSFITLCASTDGRHWRPVFSAELWAYYEFSPTDERGSHRRT